MARIGVQSMMLKNEFEADGAFTTLKRLSELGFNAVEISQISMSEANVGEIARARLLCPRGQRSRQQEETDQEGSIHTVAPVHERGTGNQRKAPSTRWTADTMRPGSSRGTA